ncbi:MAG UNVERIFIED_CONTAM: AI-2E family transporter, partial [Thermobifida fusca]
MPEREVRVVVEEAPPVPEVEDDLLRKASDVAWRLLIIGVVIALILWGAIYIRVVTIPVILAVFVTALLMPPTQWLR